MRILVIGDEEQHQALREKLGQSPSVEPTYLASDNPGQPIGEKADYVLSYENGGLQVRRGNRFLRVDFAGGQNAHRRIYGGGRGQMVAKAVGLRRENIVPTVLDATAGLGKDAFVLATLGCTVRMCERVPLVYALLEDGLRRAEREGDADLRAIVARMELQGQDAHLLLPTLTEENRLDVVYLDPMFPEGRRKSAVKKDMATFHDLVGADPDADELLPLALRTARYRVVVKRPRLAPPLAGIKPALTFEGDSTRFDVYPLRSMVKPLRDTNE